MPSTPRVGHSPADRAAAKALYAGYCWVLGIRSLTDDQAQWLALVAAKARSPLLVHLFSINGPPAEIVQEVCTSRDAPLHNLEAAYGVFHRDAEGSAARRELVQLLREATHSDSAPVSQKRRLEVVENILHGDPRKNAKGPISPFLRTFLIRAFVGTSMFLVVLFIRFCMLT